jgi:hypothetical protein
VLNLGLFLRVTNTPRGQTVVHAENKSRLIWAGDQGAILTVVKDNRALRAVTG